MTHGTITAASGLVLALCGCCTDHNHDRPLEPRIVTCPECGAQCSCVGCVAEVDAGYRA